MSSVLAANGKSSSSLKFQTLEELYAEPAGEAEFCVEGLIPTAGLTLLAGKPKAGKSTLARDLASCVVQGQDFLGRSTSQGRVLYLALEEKKSEVAKHFTSLGLAADSPILLHCGGIGRGDEAVKEIEAMIHTCGDVKLVIVDPLFHLVRVRDTNEYGRVYEALQKLVELGRASGAAILVVHHLKKRESDDITDGALGSTAIAAAVDTFIALKANGERRSIASRQRYGVQMEETSLLWDSEVRRMSLGQTSSVVLEEHHTTTVRRIEADIIRFVTTQPDSTREDVFRGVVGRASMKLGALAVLVGNKAIVVSGAGLRGDPYTYSIHSMGQAEAGLDSVIVDKEVENIVA